MFGGLSGALALLTNPPAELSAALSVLADLVQGGERIRPEPLPRELAERIEAQAAAASLPHELLTAAVRVHAPPRGAVWPEHVLRHHARVLAQLVGAVGLVDGVRAYCRAEDRERGSEDARRILADYLLAVLARVDRAQLAAMVGA